jgi:dTDP-4-dehydrorhamnose reductase
LARQIVLLSRCDSYGLYHATSESSCSWYEFARQIFTLTGVQVDLQVAAPGEFPAKTPRPAYSVLENQRLKRMGLNQLPSWQEGLQNYLASAPVPAVGGIA